ncbi:MAG: ABC transporter ATP-binding protein [Candidatus Cloacimonetes bacterium]|jgi:NitT/TauT family transport system ATP-binding protein|nr:ABC transporter ATP-binding protein [Candidatus Cloacimonadota bacterium]
MSKKKAKAKMKIVEPHQEKPKETPVVETQVVETQVVETPIVTGVNKSFHWSTLFTSFFGSKKESVDSSVEVKTEVSPVETELKPEAVSIDVVEEKEPVEDSELVETEIKETKEPVTPIALLTAPSVVKCTNVCKYFGEGDNRKVALQDLTFEVKDIPGTGELISIVGMSGCGKSTLLRILAGLEPHYPPSSGEVLVLGDPITPACSQRGLVDQKYSLLPHLTVLDNVAFGLRLQGMGKEERYVLAREWISKVGLTKAELKYPSQLSGGMQQRVSIAATLILKPRIILMDEPFGALDPKTRMSMQKLLVDLWNEQSSTIFFVTHQMDEAIYLGDRIFRMGSNPGRLVEILEVPRPDVPPEDFRKEKWFGPAVEELARRLETDSPANSDWFYKNVPPSQIFENYKKNKG